MILGAVRTKTFISVGLLVGAACWGCSNAKAKQEPPPVGSASGTPAAKAAGGVTRVEVATVEPSAASLTIQLPGEVEATRDALLASALGGYVERVAVKVGDRVKKGQALAWVDSATHRARVRQAQIEVDASKRELARAQALGGSIARIELEAAQTRHDAARAGLATARVASGRAVVTAPFAGTVVDLNAEVGEVAAPGTPLVRVVQLVPAKVTASVPDRDVVVLREGQSARVVVAANATPIAGVVKHIRRAADLRTRAFQVEIEVANEDQRLLPGMIAQVHIEPAADEPRLVISQDWLVTRGKDVGAFVVDGEVARYRALTLGPVIRDRIVISGGLSSGDLLVITGHRNLADGDRLLISRRGVCCTDGRVVYR